MNKKLSISLVPLLAITAFAAMPVAAQAAPYIFINNAKVAQGQQVPLTLSGTLKNKNSIFGEIECKASAAAYLENPLGGGPAVGKVQSIGFSRCVESITLTGEKLPWKIAVVTEGGVFRAIIGEKGNHPESIGITASSAGVPLVQYFGQLSPLVVQPPPDELRFDETSGELETLPPTNGKFAGSLRFEGSGSAIEIRKK
jgi:hypothetical protein